MCMHARNWACRSVPKYGSGPVLPWVVPLPLVALPLVEKCHRLMNALALLEPRRPALLARSVKNLLYRKALRLHVPRSRDYKDKLWWSK